MSLFIGNLSSSIKQSELETLFEEYGPCKIKLQPYKSFGFVDYQEERDAEEALSNLKGKDVKGLDLRLEWSLRSGKNKDLPKRDNKYYDSDRKRDSGCFNCGSKNHKLRECTRKKKSRSRDRSRERYRRRSPSKSSTSRSRSRDRNRRSERKRRDSRSKSRSHTKDRKRRHSSSSSRN